MLGATARVVASFSAVEANHVGQLDAVAFVSGGFVVASSGRPADCLLSAGRYHEAAVQIVRECFHIRLRDVTASGLWGLEGWCRFLRLGSLNSMDAE